MKLAPHLLGPIAVSAYSYMALVPLIQPPIMRLLTTKKERRDPDGGELRRAALAAHRLPDRRAPSSAP